MAISYNCGDCNGTGKSAWTPYDATPCKKCDGRGFIHAGGTAPTAYGKQVPTSDRSESSDEG